jgi:tRNA threonylcarbamoyladenosine biosynthesis protein TsaE
VLHYTLASLEHACSFLLEAGKNHQLWCFYGEMGAGKTTLIKHLLTQMGVEETVSSPSFSIVNEYHTRSGKPIYHFDFYRIKSLEEVYDIGYEDYFDSGHLCIIEWPEKIEALLSQELHLKIHIALAEGGGRNLWV